MQTDRPAWCPSPLPPRCQEPGHVLTNTTDKCCKGRPEVFPGAGLCCVGRGDDCGSHDVDFPVWAIVLISVSLARHSRDALWTYLSRLVGSGVKSGG